MRNQHDEWGISYIACISKNCAPHQKWILHLLNFSNRTICHIVLFHLSNHLLASFLKYLKCSTYRVPHILFSQQTVLLQNKCASVFQELNIHLIRITLLLCGCCLLLTPSLMHFSLCLIFHKSLYQCNWALFNLHKAEQSYHKLHRLAKG